MWFHLFNPEMVPLLRREIGEPTNDKDKDSNMEWVVRDLVNSVDDDNDKDESN